MPSRVNLQSQIKTEQGGRAFNKTRRNQNTYSGSSINTATSFNELSNYKRSLYSISSELETNIMSLNSNQVNFDDENYEDDSSLELDSDSEQMTTSVTDVNGSSINIAKRLDLKVNPFKPSSYKPKMSFERRRWAHTFPLRSDGTPIFQHWTSVPPAEMENEAPPISTSFSNNNGGGGGEFDHQNVSPDSSKSFIAQNYKQLVKNNQLVILFKFIF